MKKLLVVALCVAVIVAPVFLPLPMLASGWLSQYAMGDTITVDLAAWNLTPLERRVAHDTASNIVLVVDGNTVATTEVDVSDKIERFSRVSQTVSYTLSKTPGSIPRYDIATSTLKLPAGPHDISLHWLGSSTWSHHATIVQL